MIAPYNGRVVIDIGTGDGVFIRRHARSNPDCFCIGIDSNRSNLGKISEKIYRKASKGGAPNALFIEASVEDLPTELEGIAEIVHIQFPWGSLLRAVATGEKKILSNLNQICQNNALMKVVISLDPTRDAVELERLKIQDFNLDYFSKVVIDNYKEAGFDIVEAKILSQKEYLTLHSSWAKRICQNRDRSPIYLLARARK